MQINALFSSWKCNFILIFDEIFPCDILITSLKSIDLIIKREHFQRFLCALYKEIEREKERAKKNKYIQMYHQIGLSLFEYFKLNCEFLNEMTKSQTHSF